MCICSNPVGLSVPLFSLKLYLRPYSVQAEKKQVSMTRNAIITDHREEETHNTDSHNTIRIKQTALSSSAR